MALSNVKTGWTPEMRERYFSWFYQAFNFQGGRSYIGFINNARKAALAHVPESKFDHYNVISGDTLLTSSGIDLANVFGPKGPGKNWKEQDIKPLLSEGLGKRNFVQGKNMYTATICVSCHTMHGSGGISGPDLSQLGTRFSQEDILTSIIDPSKVISDQYAATILSLKNGQSMVGNIIDENEQVYRVSQNPFATDEVREVAKDEVTGKKLSDVSSMPPGLINRLNEEELKDLLAFLVAGGNPEHSIYSSE
jgi:putative heme-binding domain-containing protein